MLDIYLGIDEVKTLNATADQFGVPVESVGVTKEGLAIPVKPLMYFGMGENGMQFVDPLKTDNLGLSENLKNEWRSITMGISYLTNPYTSSRRLTGDIAAAASEVFTAGLKVSESIPDIGIVMPPYVGFSPQNTTLKNLSVQGLSFQFSLWKPGPVEVERFKNDAGERVELVDFTLFLKAPNADSKMRKFAVTSHRILSGSHQ